MTKEQLETLKASFLLAISACVAMAGIVEAIHFKGHPISVLFTFIMLVGIAFMIYAFVIILKGWRRR